MSAELAASMNHSLLTAEGFRFEVVRAAIGQPWNVVVGDQPVGYMQQDGVKSWAGVEIFVRGAILQLYEKIV